MDFKPLTIENFPEQTDEEKNLILAKEIAHIMENIVNNELIIRNFSVDVGVVFSIEFLLDDTVI
ncbi:MAG: hypothetical protein ACI4EA_08585 [Candidatus Ornithomonoglobus sp.]